MHSSREPVAIRLPKTYDAEQLVRNLQILREVEATPQPGPYHKGEWKGIALHSTGGKDSVFPSAPGLDSFRETENLRRTPYFRWILDDLKCPKEVVRILFLPPGGHIKDHFDFHTSFQFGLLRLHIPIITHPDVEFVIDGERVEWKPGELWYGDFSKVHSVKNNSPVVRAHMVIDVQINEFLLRLFPEDFVARRRREGISMTRESVAASATELRRFACDFRIPGEFMPMFVIGKPLSTLTRGTTAAVRVIDGKLTVLIDQEPAFRLERISEDTFSIAGLPPGISLRFLEENHSVREIILDLKGVPKDLYSARLGTLVGPFIRQRQVSLPVLTKVLPASGEMV
ncbi:MAG: aspartyl/asparaginyl beta-hydroxylase domain-containing protein [Acidobacteria bacterium]|nr:aspartyl/asparaginyl beta-hydroxylase domain-containing protein [Acidobacteriota bacterium]